MRRLVLLAGFICIVFNAFADFYLVRDRIATALWYDGQEQVVKTAVNMLIEDSKLVCEQPFTVIGQPDSSCVVIGVIGESSDFKTFLSHNQIDVSDIVGKWEAFKIETVANGGKNYLVIAGSDPRGTAYGVLELSRKLGVSPWVWWADVIPEKRENIVFGTREKIQESPSVQYRGIFVNDEDWGLMPWSSKTFEPTGRKGAIGPKTYSKIFELLLRLRANTIWPAMHECTIPFYCVDGNKEAADKYGIVVGTSHCEPLMRNSAGEWDNQKYGSYNYQTNKESIRNYWTERLQQVKHSENFYTIGMRGVHDGRMHGVKTLDEETEVLGEVIADQRELLANNIGKNVADLPQAFIPYKEVLKAYDNGLRLPEDVTLVWCDDNHGYITRLSNENEQKRSGGSGVYYHVSYWGKPHDYLWLASTQPALVYKEMKKAWNYNARKLWILNVGDIKPSEYIMEFFLDMAWNIDSIAPNSIYRHQCNWLTKNLGNEYIDSIAYIMRKYYHLAGQRKPEHLGWNRVEALKERSVVKDSEFNPFVFGDEIRNRIESYDRLEELSLNIYSKLPAIKRSAYFQLVHYPVCASAAMNRKMLYAQKARLFAKYGLPVANEYSEKALCAYGRIAELTYFYNMEILKGKWNGMMDMKPRDLPVFQAPCLPDKVVISDSDHVKVWVENDTIPGDLKEVMHLPAFIKNRSQEYTVSFFSEGRNKSVVSVVNKPVGIEVAEISTGLLYETCLSVSVDKESVVKEGRYDIVLNVNGKPVTVRCIVKNGLSVGDSKCIEKNRMISFCAADYTSESTGMWRMEGLGHSGSSVGLPIAKRISLKEPHLAYEVFTESSGSFSMKVATVPSHPANGKALRYALVIDDEEPLIISVKADFLSEKWSENVLRNQTLTVSQHQFDRPGKHIIRLYALDEELYFDQLMLDFLPDRNSYLLPARID